MEVLVIAGALIVALIVTIPAAYVVATLARNAVTAIRSRGTGHRPGTSKQQEGYVDSLAWTLRWGEVVKTDPGESHEGLGGPPPPGGP